MAKVKKPVGRRAPEVNATLLAMLVLLILWILLAFVVAVPAGWVHLCYAAAAVLFVRRVVVGAPRFYS